MSINFKDFAGSLATTSLDFICKDHRAISKAPPVTPGYVWPNLSLDSKDATPPEYQPYHPIALVSAPGAMGKSEAAKALANRLGTIYIDLSAINVGNGTLVGEISKAIGPQALESFREEMQNGRATLILDSTDEAQLRAGSNNYLAFLEDLDWFINRDLQRPQIVLFGRSDSIELTGMALDAIGSKSSILYLQPLDYKQSIELISGSLDLQTYTLHRTQPEPFGRLRDLVISDLAGAVLGSQVPPETLFRVWSRCDDFLGYPPVLLAVAERLKTSNPQAEFERLGPHAKTREPRERGRLLQEIAEHILDREAEKVQRSVGESLAIGEMNPLRKTFYTRDEQAARLLKLTGTQGIFFERPLTLRDDERAKYEALVDEFIRDHPFIRSSVNGSVFANHVFSDYLRAWAVSSPVSHTISSDRSPFLKTLPSTGPFFSRFLAALPPVGHKPHIPEDLINDAVESHLLSSEGARAVFKHRKDQEPTLHLLDANLKADEVMDFDVVEVSGILSLLGPLSRTAILSDHAVVLSSGPSGQLDLGPDFLLVAEEFEISAKLLRAVHGPFGAGVFLLSKQEVLHDPDLRVSTFSSKDLVTFWPNHWSMWKQYVPPVPKTTQISHSLTTQVIVALRRLLLAFHSTSRQAPAVSADKVDRVLVGRNDVAQSVRDALLDLGVVTRHGAQYYLDLSKLGEFETSWDALNSGDPYKTLQPLCVQVINANTFTRRHLPERPSEP